MAASVLRLTHRTLLVVIDAQRAFVDPAGSLARTFGIDDIQPSTTALRRLCAFLTDRWSEAHIVLIRSEYRPGQFTKGQLDHPLADLCVPDRNIDCEWPSGLDTSRASAVITKHHADAIETVHYRDVIEQAIAAGTQQILCAGFQFTTCVSASALSTFRMVGGRGVRVGVVEGLSGARASSYEPTPLGLSRFEATRRTLRASGVTVVKEFDDLTRRSHSSSSVIRRSS